MAGTSYTRQSTLTDGDTITASLFNAEYNQLVTAFSYAASGTTGHQHDGGAGEGGNIEIIGDQDFNNKIVVDSSNNRWSVYVEVGGSAVEQVRIEDGVVYPVTDSDVDLGTNALRFKDAYIDSLTATGNLTVGGNITVTGNVDVDGIVEFDGLSGTGSVTVTDILDQDDMSGNSATALATQQSIKAYVDAQQDTVDTFAEILALSNTSSGTDVELTTTDKVQFRDSAIYINSSADGQLDIVADTEIQIAATTIDINGAINASGEIIAASLDISGNIDVDGVTNLDVVDIDGAVDMATTLAVAGNVDFNGDLDVDGVTNLDVVDIDGAVNMATTLLVTGNVDFNGDLDVDGTTNLDVVDIDGAVDMASTLTVASNIVVGGTVDGRDVATDGTKLDGIEASADVTDTTNVTAAGALMDSELTAIASVKALNQGVATTDSPTFAAVTVNGNVEFDGLSGTGSVTVTDILDQDDMSGNSATALATQQSIKAYVDAQQDTVDTLAEILALSNATGGSNILFGDSSGATDDRLQFGASQDLSIYHDGSDSYIHETGTGSLNILGQGRITLKNSAGDETLADFLTNSRVDLYYDNAVKFSTTSGGILVTGEVAATSLDISGDIDVDGTTNLDVVDIDGAVDMASTLAVGGVVTANAGVVVDNITIDGNEIDVGSGDLTLDVAGDIVLDANGGDFFFKDGGVTKGTIQNSSDDLVIKVNTQDKDLKFQGNDGGSLVTALTLDMSNAGRANFNNDIGLSDNRGLRLGSGDDSIIYNDGSNLYIKNSTLNQDIIFQGNDDGSAGTTALTLDMSNAGAATFNSSVNVNADFKVHPNNTTRGLNITSTTTGTAGDTTIYDTIAAGFGRHVFKTDGAERFRIASDGAASFTGTVTANAGVVVDELTIDADTITATDDFIVDAVGEIVLDADNGGQVHLKDGGTEYARFFQDSNRLFIQSAVSDADILIRGSDGGSTITALTLDMSAAGAATFNAGATFGGTVLATNGSSINAILRGGDGNSKNLIFQKQTGSAEQAKINAIGDDLTIYTGSTSVERASFNATEAVFNDSGTDTDFRVESDANTHALFVNAENSRLGLSQSNPSYSVHIGDGGAAERVHMEGNGGGAVFSGVDNANNSNFGFRWGHLNGTDRLEGAIGTTQIIDWRNTALYFKPNATEVLALTSSEVTVNNGSADVDFRVESDANTHMLFVDGGNSHVGIGTATLNRSGLGSDHIVLTVGADSQMGMLELQATRTSDADLGRVSFLNAGTRRAEIVAARIDADNSTKLYFQTSDAGSLGTRLTIGKDGAATFSSSVTATKGIFTQTSGDFAASFTTPFDYIAKFESTDSAGFIVLQDNNSTDNANRIGVVGNSLQIEAGNVENVAFTSAGPVFNEAGADLDFRVESDSNTHMLFVDGGANTVNIGGTAAGANVISMDAGRIRLHKASDWNIESDGGTAHIRFLQSGAEKGSITTTTSATTYNTSSDQRLKENIADADDSGNLIDAIQVRQFDWKADGSHQDYGMIAQELQAVAPEAVSVPENPEDMMGVDYSKLVPMMLKEIQSLRNRVEQLENA